MVRLFSLLTLCIFCLAASAQTLRVPPRNLSALPGSKVVTAITALSREAREQRLFEEVTSGNVPTFMRALCPVNVSATINGQLRGATFFVIPDYLAVGADSDYFLAPMTPLLAQRIADSLHCTLPTAKMVDAIYAAASVKLAPNPIAPSAEMVTVPVFNDHNTMVRQQRALELGAHPLGELVGGDKKDVVISNKIYHPLPLPKPQHPVVIYGWHRLDGTPIQPVYNGHDETYADYSHGIRLVQDTLLLDGTPRRITDILTDPAMAQLLSSEGVIPIPRYPLPNVPSSLPLERTQPGSFLLEQNFPNPFNPSTTIRYTLSSPSGMRLAILDLRGATVRQFASANQTTGPHEVVWDGRNESGVPVAAGTYIYRLSVRDAHSTGKMVLLR